MPQLNMFDSKLPAHPTMEKLIEEMMAMEDDPLADAGTNVVISRGNPKARLLIVGEAPGPQENIQGKPFVGRAGQLLDKILLAAGFDPDQDVYITNSVFRMPPGEGGKAFRKPNNQEIAYYHPLLQKIIQVVDPLIILLCGNVACQSMLGTTGIARLRGEWSQIQGRWIMPIFHPSYLLRNPSRNPGSPKALMWEDIQEVRQKYDALIGESGEI
jgi:DNA polymerase